MAETSEFPVQLYAKRDLKTDVYFAGEELSPNGTAHATMFDGSQVGADTISL